MSTLQEHARSIAVTAGDYRKNELGPLTAAHESTWIEQFDDEDRLPVLAELDHVLRKTYFSEASVTLSKKRRQRAELVGTAPATFWKSAGILNIQQGGGSQAEMLQRFEAVLQEEFGIGIRDCAASSANFIYLDDAIFTGNRFRRDLEPWIATAAPQKATVHVIVSALHTGSTTLTSRWKRQLIEPRKPLLS